MRIKVNRMSLIPVFLILFVSACTTTQAPETQFDDTAITAEIKAELVSDGLETLTAVEVNTTNGVVTLAGEVRSEELKRRAEEIAHSVEGVQEVHNNLQVAEPERETIPPPETAPVP
ncbi:MAG: BON domain-containing protein [Acidobacteriota bacterium]